MPFPLGQGGTVADDLEFCGRLMVGADVRRLRKAAVRALRAFAKELAPLSAAMRAWAVPAATAVAPGVEVGFIAGLVYATAWPDKDLPWLFVDGANIVGDIPAAGVFRAAEVPAASSME